MRLTFSGADSEDGEDFTTGPLVLAPDGQEPGTTPAPWPTERIAVIAAVLRAHALHEETRRVLLDTVGTIEETVSAVPALAAAIERRFPFVPWMRLIRRRPLLLAGPPGAGKTSVAAKLAARLPGRRTILINTDTERAGSAAQIAGLAATLGCRIDTVSDAAAAAALAATACDALSPVIIDTAGIDPLDTAALHRLDTMITRTRARPVLVLPASIGTDEAAAASRAFARIGIRDIIVTRLDMVRRLGGIFAAAEEGRFAFAAGSFTGHVAYGLRGLTPTILARRLFAAAMDGRRWRTF